MLATVRRVASRVLGPVEHDAFVETLLEEVWIVLQGEEVGRFDRDEHKDEVQRF